MKSNFEENLSEGKGFFPVRPEFRSRRSPKSPFPINGCGKGVFLSFQEKRPRRDLAREKSLRPLKEQDINARVFFPLKKDHRLRHPPPA